MDKAKELFPVDMEAGVIGEYDANAASRRAFISGYQLATDGREELEKENARIKLLLERQVKDNYNIIYPLADKEISGYRWQQYQKENKL